MQLSLRLPFFMLLILIVQACGYKKPVELHLKLKKGQVYQYQLSTDQDIRQNQLGENIAIKQTVAYGMRLEVKDTDFQGNYLLHTTYNRVYIRQHAPSDSFIYDSDKDSIVPPLAKPLAATLGSSFDMLMNPQGRIIAIKGMDKIISDLTKKLEPAKANAKESLEDSLEKYAHSKEFAANMESSWNIYPSGSVKKGDFWSRSLKTSGSFPMIADNTYYLKDITDSTAVLKLDSRLRSNDGIGALKGMQYNISGAQKGIIVLDLENGMIISEKIDQRIKGHIFRKGIGESPDIPIDVKSSISILNKRIR